MTSGIRVSTVRFIDALAAREGGMCAFEEYYTERFSADDRACIVAVEGGKNWRTKNRFGFAAGNIAHAGVACAQRAG